MFKIKSFVFALCLVSFFSLSDLQAAKAKAVTTDKGGGRLGDQLIGYLHAKWISYHYGIPLLLNPFPYADQLKLYYAERKLTDADFHKYDHVLQPKGGMNIDFEDNISALYVIPYFPEAKWEHAPENNWYYFPVDWNDKKFKRKIQSLVKPLKWKPYLKLPKDRITVAVHVRQGGGFDDDNTRRGAPLKLPPESYYIEQIKNLFALLGNKPIYVYIFTDDKQPEKIVERFTDATNYLDIQYECRTQGNSHDSNVLEDLFEMARFDCLIRPASNFSIVASKIGNYKIVISPTHFTWINSDVGYVDEVEIEDFRI